MLVCIHKYTNTSLYLVNSKQVSRCELDSGGGEIKLALKPFYLHLDAIQLRSKTKPQVVN